jgi:hypothetical protein
VIWPEIKELLFHAFPETYPRSLISAEQDSACNHPKLQPQRCPVYDEQIHIVTTERSGKLIVQTGIIEQITARA